MEFWKRSLLWFFCWSIYDNKCASLPLMVVKYSHINPYGSFTNNKVVVILIYPFPLFCADGTHNVLSTWQPCSGKTFDYHILTSLNCSTLSFPFLCVHTDITIFYQILFFFLCCLNPEMCPCHQRSCGFWLRKSWGCSPNWICRRSRLWFISCCSYLQRCVYQHVDFQEHIIEPPSFFNNLKVCRALYLLGL